MNISLISYAIGSVSFLGLSLYAFIKRFDQNFIWVSFITSSWLACLALQASFGLFQMRFIWIGEVIYLATWLIYIARIQKISIRWIFALASIQIFYIWFSNFFELYLHIPTSFSLLGHLALAVTGLVLIERYYIESQEEKRWKVKSLCFAQGALCLYEFYFYAEALLFSSIRADLWQARGLFLALLTPLFAIYLRRNATEAQAFKVSRQVVFHSVALIGSGLYLFSMSAFGYYLKFFGGEWGIVSHIVFMAFAFLMLALFIFSTQIRAYVKVFMSKHFFKHFYDYRQEWLRLMSTLSNTESHLSLKERVILSLAQLVESQGGALWLKESNGFFIHHACYGNPGFQSKTIYPNEPIARFMEQRDWILNLHEKFEGLCLPDWLKSNESAWLLMPLILENQIFGLVLLAKPSVPIAWNWEVRDLLKSASRLAASHLALEDAANALSEAKQFEGFNRLSAFVIHDLKNVIAQLSLMLCNVEKHKQNPEFIEDVIKTVDHSVHKMSSLMSQLKNSSPAASVQTLDLSPLLNEVVNSRKKQHPIPQLKTISKPLLIQANRDRLAFALEHIIHNAQDAAGKFGHVLIKVRTDEKNWAWIEIEDDGLGMDESFIQKRLFKPFDTTKGLTGMGIGAYESREYVRSLGGDLSVQSEAGRGSLFCFSIPLSGEML